MRKPLDEIFGSDFINGSRLGAHQVLDALANGQAHIRLFDGHAMRNRRARQEALNTVAGLVG